MVAGGQAKVRQFGKFLLYRHLRSEGECIESFACKKKDTAEEVEIRILKVAANKNSPLLKRFVHELKMVARLRHPAIIRVLEAGVTDGRGYFTTPLRKSMRLEDFMEKRGKGLPAKDVLSCAEIITDAIALMHQAKIIHRTLSPTSVHVDLERRFPFVGECSAMRDMRMFSLTSEGYPSLAKMVETPEGMDGKALDERSDVFLLCALFFRMLTNIDPLDSEEEQLKIPPLDVQESGPYVDGLKEIIMKGLELEPEGRYSSAFELRDALRLVARHSKIALIDEETRESQIIETPHEESKDDEEANQPTEVLARCHLKAKREKREKKDKREKSGNKKGAQKAANNEKTTLFEAKEVAVAALCGGAMAGAVVIALNYYGLRKGKKVLYALAGGVLAVISLTLIGIMVQARGLAMGLPFVTLGVIVPFLKDLPPSMFQRFVLLVYYVIWQWVVAVAAQRISRRVQGDEVTEAIKQGSNKASAGWALCVGIVTVLLIFVSAMGSAILEQRLQGMFG